jgi:hypothetical protein
MMRAWFRKIVDMIRFRLGYPHDPRMRLTLADMKKPDRSR